MRIAEIIGAVRALSRGEKFQLAQLLLEDLAREELPALFKEGQVDPIDTPADAPKAATQQTPELWSKLSAERVVAPGILRSQQAYRRDLPELLAQKKWLRKWVCYRGDERIGIASSMSILMRECLKRGWDDDEFIISIIEPQGLIEEEELDPPDPSLMVDEESDS